MATKIYKNVKRLSDLAYSKEVLNNMFTILAHRSNNYSQNLNDITQKKIINASQTVFDESNIAVPISLHFRDDSILRLTLKNGSIGEIGKKGKTGEIGDKGDSPLLNTDRSNNWLIIANDLTTNDNKKVLSALQGVNMMTKINNLSETYISDYQYSLLFTDHVTIEAEFETIEDMQLVQLIAVDNDSHKRYVKYWTYESEGEEEFFVLNHFSSTETNKVYDSVYCDLWNDIYLGGTKGYFEATTNQLTDGSPLYILDKLTDEYVKIVQYDPDEADNDGYSLEYGERRFEYYLPNTKSYIDVNYTLSDGYDFNLKANELELNIYVLDSVIDGEKIYSKVKKDEVDPNSLTIYYRQVDEDNYEIISNVNEYIQKKALRYYKRTGSVWTEVESIDEIDVENFEEHFIVKYESSSNTNTFTRFASLETNRGEKYYEISTDIINNYTIDYYIYDEDRQYFTRRITTSTDADGNTIFDYEYKKIVIPFWLEAEFLTEIEDSNVRLISNQIFSTEGDEEQVAPIYITGLEFENNNIIIAKNLNKDVKFNINPVNANQTNLVLEYDENVIDFYEDGRIAAIESNDITKTTSLKVYYENDPSIYDILNIKVVTPISKITVPESSLNIYPGTTHQLEWTIDPIEVTNDNVAFEVSDESLLYINENGLVSPKKNSNGETNTGNCIIKIYAKDGFGASTSINVLVANPATSLKILSSPVAFVGKPYQLETELMPLNVTEKTLIYESSNPEVIEISNSGLCTPKNVGECTLTVSTIDGSNISVAQNVNVSIGVDEIVFIDDVTSLDIGLSKKIRFEILPENAHNKSFDLWVSDSSQLAYTTPELVDGYSNRYETTITSLAKGNPQIIIESLDGTGVIVSKDIDVTVPMNDITLNYDSLTMYIDDDVVILRPIFNNNEEQPSNDNIVWHTSNNLIAEVDQQGRVRPINAGKCIISAISDDGNGVIASCNVEVKVKVESIKLNDGDESGIDVVVGNYEFIKANVYPDYATDQILRWVSDNTDVCVVEDNGTIFGKSIGSATITATSSDLNASKSIIVNVIEKIENN